MKLVEDGIYELGEYVLMMYGAKTDGTRQIIFGKVSQGAWRFEYGVKAMSLAYDIGIVQLGIIKNLTYSITPETVVYRLDTVETMLYVEAFEEFVPKRSVNITV